MAGGFLGLPNPWSASPLQSLTDMVAGGADQGSPSPPTPAPAAAPDPTTTGSIGGGGQSRGFGDVLSDAFSGKGIMGARPGDETVDPNTGVSAGQQRQMSMQSMMGMGLTLLAAGMRQTDDSRAAVLARAPAMLNNSDQLNNFAKMRLEMANARLKERQLQNSEETQRRWGALFGGSGAAAGAPGIGTAPTPAAPAPLPGAPAITGGAAPADTSTAPALQAPAAGAPVTPGAPGAATPQQEHPLLAGISPGVRMLLAGMGPEKGMEKLLDIRRGLDEQEVMGQPRQDPNTGKWIADKIKNGKVTGVVDFGQSKEMAGAPAVDPDTGQKVQTFQRDGQTTRTDKLGDVARPVETVEEGGRTFNVRRNAAGAVIEKTALPAIAADPVDTERRKGYLKMEEDTRKGAKEGSRLTGLLNDFQKAIDDPNVYFGAQADKVAGGRKIIAALGGSDEGLTNTNLAQKVQNQLALMVRNPEGGFGGMPGSTTDRDVTFLLQSVPSLMATREGAQVVKDSFQAMATRNIELDKMRRDYLKTHKELDGAFEDMVADHFDKPILDEAQRKQAERLARAAPSTGNGGGNQDAPAPIRWGRDPKTGLPVRM